MRSETTSITPEEARRSLETIREVERATRSAIGRRGGGEIVAVWGVVWMIGFLSSHFLRGPAVGAVWAVVDLIGIAATLWIVSRVSRRVRDPVGPRIGLFWLCLLLFCALFIWMAQPLDFDRMGLLIALSMMFGYVTLGIFVDRPLLWIGIAVSVLAVAGYLALPAHFGIWMAILGGGTMVGSGLYIRRHWR